MNRYCCVVVTSLVYWCQYDNLEVFFLFPEQCLSVLLFAILWPSAILMVPHVQTFLCTYIISWLQFVITEIHNYFWIVSVHHVVYKMPQAATTRFLRGYEEQLFILLCEVLKVAFVSPSIIASTKTQQFLWWYATKGRFFLTDCGHTVLRKLTSCY